MWIRSQDKETLSNVDYIDVNDIVISGGKNCGELDPLGTYATEKRALEVLDEIEFNIENHITVQEWKQFQLDLACGYSLTNVYQMPKE